MRKLLLALSLLGHLTAWADTNNYNVLDNTSITVSGGSINGATIGQTTPAAGSFTTLTATTPVGVPSGGTGIGTLTGLALGNGTSAFSVYPGASCTNQFPRSLSASGVATCATVSLTADVTGITPTANGGTGTAFFAVAGPTVARVYTFPDAAATIIYAGGALGTPSSGVATNLTGTASGLTAGTVTTNANLTGPITSSGNATSVAAQTGTGSTFVMQASPTLTTPTIGVATATSINKMAITAPATSSTLAVADGKTLTASNTLTLAGTDGVTYTGPATSATLARTDAAQTFTGNQTFSNSVLAANGSAAAPSYSFSSQSALGFFRTGTNGIGVVGSNGTPGIAMGQAFVGINVGANQTIGFSAFNDPTGGGADVLLVRDAAAGILAQRNGVNAQTFRLYNTFTDASNYERLGLNWSGNLASINPEAAGTGTQRNLGLATAGVGRVLVGGTTDDGATTFQVNGNTKLAGTLSYTKQEADLSYTYSTPTTGQTVTLATGTETAIIEPAGTLASLTVTLPGCTASYDGSLARFSSTQIITSLTVNATSGTVVDSPASLTVGGGSGFICRGSTTKWYRLY